MKITRHTLLALPLLGILCASTGCKPSEKNYKAAYDATLRKREAAKKLEQEIAPGVELVYENAPAKQTVDGTDVYVKTLHLRCLDNGAPLPKPFMVAVGMYNLPTNARSQVADLKAQGYDGAVAMIDMQSHYFAMAASFDNLAEAARFAKTFQEKHPSMPYVGLEGSPVVCEMAGRR